MDQAELCQRLIISLMIASSALLAVVAAADAGHQWKQLGVQRARVLADEQIALYFSAVEQRERAGLMSGSYDADAWAAMEKRNEQRRLEAGLKPVTLGEGEAKQIAGPLPDENVQQSPRAIRLGLLALLLATGAGIWDVWLV